MKHHHRIIQDTHHDKVENIIYSYFRNRRNILLMLLDKEKRKKENNRHEKTPRIMLRMLLYKTYSVFSCIHPGVSFSSAALRFFYESTSTNLPESHFFFAALSSTSNSPLISHMLRNVPSLLLMSSHGCAYSTTCPLSRTRTLS